MRKGTWGRGDAATLGRGDVGTRGRGDVETWGREAVGTWRPEDLGTRGAGHENVGTRKCGDSCSRGLDLQTTPDLCAEFVKQNFHVLEEGIFTFF